MGPHSGMNSWTPRDVSGPTTDRTELLLGNRKCRTEVVTFSQFESKMIEWELGLGKIKKK